MYQHDVFYQVPKNRYEEIVDWARANTYWERVDAMDGWRRIDSDITVEEYMQKRKESNFVHDVIIHRKGYPEWADKSNPWNQEHWCILVGGSLSDLYLFVYVDESKLEELLTKFNLVEL